MEMRYEISDSRLRVAVAAASDEQLEQRATRTTMSTDVANRIRVSRNPYAPTARRGRSQLFGQVAKSTRRVLRGHGNIRLPQCGDKGIERHRRNLLFSAIQNPTEVHLLSFALGSQPDV